MLTLFVLLLAAISGLAQEVRATLGGRVTDAQGAIIPNAAVMVVSDYTGVVQRTKTNKQGNWAIEFLIPGHYRFTVAADGFKTSERTDIELHASDSKQFYRLMEVCAASQSIVLTSKAPLLNNTSAVSGTLTSS